VTRRPRAGGIAGQPALLGAIALLVSMVAIYIVYNANAGLPFVPTYDVRAVIDDAEHMGKTGDVRMAGVLVGKVGGRHLEVMPDGTTRAVLDLALDRWMNPLPADTQIRMRAMSTLGSNYVELVPGRSKQPLRGDPPTIHSDNAPPEISFSDSLEAYDKQTRGRFGRWIGGAGDTLVGRGSDLNAIVAIAPQTLRHLDGAGRVLSAGGSTPDLATFINGFLRLSRAVEPVAAQQAAFFRGLDATFGPLAAASDDVAAATAAAPPLFDAGIRGLPVQSRMVRATTDLFAALRPGIHAVGRASADIEAMATGSPRAFDSVARLSPLLADTGRAMSALAREPVSVPALSTAVGTFDALRPTLDDLRASQVVCNYPGVALRNLMSVLSEGTPNGNFFGVGAALVLPGPDGEAGPAAAPANGPRDRPDNYLHSTVTPSVGTGASPECEAGNEEFKGGAQAIGHVPGMQQAHTDAVTPGRPR
jgi:phospholipid/cholesterol/gamma-HCH transport system substrate-binding protein